MHYEDSTRHVVIDIETLGLEVGCPIIQIGAIEVKKEFGEWTLGRSFYTGITIESNIKNGFINISKDTLKFWSNNAESFSKIFEKLTRIKDAITSFHEYLNEIDNELNFFWCKGTDFDFPILKNAFEKFDLPVPWGYSQIRDIRTIQDPMFYGNFVPKINNHDALSDAINEATVLIAVLNRMAKLRQE